MPSSLRLALRPRTAGCVDAGHHLGGHGIRDHILDDGADDDQQGAQEVEAIGRAKPSHPPAAPASTSRPLAVNIAPIRI